jgi:hypothetical protein
MPEDDEIKSTGITIGADPELVCYDPNAGELINIANTIPRTGEFGADGHGYTAELRPNPTVSPSDLVKNLKQALCKGWDVLGKTQWQVGPWKHGKPLGGHIHFGAELTDKIVDALDNQFGILMALLEPEEEAKTRRNEVFVGAGQHINNQGQPYGALGDVRKKPYGFEYRTPSSFVVSPGISKGMFAVAKAILYEELIGGKCAWSSLPTKVREALKFSPDDFKNCNKVEFQKRLEILWPYIAKMHYFKKGQEGRDLWSNVNYLLQAINKKGFPVSLDIKKNWKITEELVKRYSLQSTRPRRAPRNRPDRATVNALNQREQLRERILANHRRVNGFMVREEGDAPQQQYRVVNGLLVPENEPAERLVANEQFDNLWRIPREDLGRRRFDVREVWRFEP